MPALTNTRKAILFDLDGTILDNYDWTYYSLKSALSAFGYPHLTSEEYDTLQGTGETQAMQTLGVPLDLVQEMINYRRDIMRASASDVIPFEGIMDLLSRLKKAECELGIVTGSSYDWVEIIPAAWQVIPCVELLVTKEDTIEAKPHPAPIIYALEKLGAHPSQAVYIGDTPRDVEAANRAGCVSVLASWNGGKYATDFTSSPNYVVSTIKELEQLLLG